MGGWRLYLIHDLGPMADHRIGLEEQTNQWLSAVTSQAFTAPRWSSLGAYDRKGVPREGHLGPLEGCKLEALFLYSCSWVPSFVNLFIPCPGSHTVFVLFAVVSNQYSFFHTEGITLQSNDCKPFALVYFTQHMLSLPSGSHTRSHTFSHILTHTHLSTHSHIHTRYTPTHIHTLPCAHTYIGTHIHSFLYKTVNLQCLLGN